MHRAQPDSALHQNGILKRLKPAAVQELSKLLEKVDLRFKEPLHAQAQRVTHVFFPASGVVSSVIDLEGGQTVETGTIGREGLVGVSVLMGESLSPTRTFVQVPGTAHRATRDDLLEFVKHHPQLQTLALRYASVQLATLAQTAACNRVHTVEERLARWLLMTRDRVDSDAFPLTQQFLAEMLGVRRPTVSLAGAILQKAGLIRYRRGEITVLDRAGLEDAACECYRTIRQRFELLP